MRKSGTGISILLLVSALLICTCAYGDSSPSELLQTYSVKFGANATAKQPQYLSRTTKITSDDAAIKKIKQLQKALQANGLYQDCRIDGWFGPYTELAVMEYQRANNLTVTGVVDDKLFKTLTTAKATTASASSTDKTAAALANSSFGKYMKPTKNCPSTNAKIVSLAKSLKGKTSYQTMKNLFYYVRDKVKYSSYYNTSKGALRTLSSKHANCCDQAHLLVALLRAAGIPARYGHATCRFKSGLTTGHVFAYAYVGGKWLLVDPVSQSNKINNPTWSARSTPKKYTTLPF
ncbi:MAG: peptidoglycan-binding protein [Candidatus Riflebacteria bacterium]|nr:peptidoglycan-binding protein [Candidatus Riflebacteria bacterium]